jgi:hypothetical protein
MSTVADEGAACVAISSTRRSAGEEPTMSRVVRRAISLLRERFSVTRLCALGGLLHALDDVHALERLLDEVVRAFAHRLHGRLDGAVGGHHHDLGVGRGLLERAEQLLAAGAGHHQIGEHHLHAVSAREIEGGLRVVGGEDAHAFALKDLLERGDVGRLVVDDEDGGRVRRGARRLRDVGCFLRGLGGGGRRAGGHGGGTLA